MHSDSKRYWSNPKALPQRDRHRCIPKRGTCVVFLYQVLLQALYCTVFYHRHSEVLGLKSQVTKLGEIALALGPQNWLLCGYRINDLHQYNQIWNKLSLSYKDTHQALHLFLMMGVQGTELVFSSKGDSLLCPRLLSHTLELDSATRL